ncbi:MAG: ATP-binding cassette domain-containing protein [Bacteroidales bacterium]|nr:ATP-binding cassette domain-containing protein [Bacteroidales bacterium]MCF8389070.1 ATP-binding cassette domain-containing protein [Bacteroidales bacterium]
MKIEVKNLIPRPLIEIPHDDSEIWDATSFTFSKNKFYYLFAPSGMGKTSLLSILYGIRNDFNGDVIINDKNTRSFTASDWSEIRKNSLSYIFQGLELFNDLSAMDNIQLNNSQKHFKTEAEITDMAKALEIEGFLKNKCGILSFGQAQRVAIIRGLCQPLELLLADEAFSHLDSRIGSLAFNLIRSELDAQNAGLIFTGLESGSPFEFSKSIQL